MLGAVTKIHAGRDILVISALEIGLILYGDILWVAMTQELVPKEVLGRVSSLVYLFAFSLGPLGILAGGVAAAAFGTRTALVISGVVSGGICLLVIFIPGVRDPERLPASELAGPSAHDGLEPFDARPAAE